MQQYLRPTYFLDYLSENVADFAADSCDPGSSPVEKAVALYYAVRDLIKYDPYDLQYSRATLKASSVLDKGSGFCVAKAVLLAAVGRAQGIPSRLGFADVVNHLSSQKLRAKMNTDLFTYHGYTEFFLDGRWVKATPAFNLSLCTKFSVKPLEFDGREDSIFHEFDATGRQHMVYVRDHGTFADLPFEKMFRAYRATYPDFDKNFGTDQPGDFEQEPRQ
ncbi:MAG: transglutaminase-like domain-containing protein [Desulforhopalus sp.]